MKFIQRLKLAGLVFGFLVAFTPSSSAQISTQVGIGSVFINGDVDYVLDAFNSFHLGVSKRVKNDWNLELKIGYGKALGLSGTYMETGANGGGLVEDVYDVVGNGVWYPNYLSNYFYSDLGMNYSLETGIPNLVLVGGGGLGISISSVRVNLLDQLDSNYSTKLPETTPIPAAKTQINGRYDSTYETVFEDGGGLIPHLSFQIGLQYKITRGMFFSVDYRYHLTGSDYLDPIKNISSSETSGNNDSVRIFTIGFVGYLLSDPGEDRGPVK